ncbi:MAG: TonB-dependent receptor domain-containing protein, partial [Gammaproteobacteria bacterium]
MALALGIAIPRAEAAEAQGCTPWIAKVVAMQGQVETRRAAEMRWRPVRLEQTFCGGEMIRVSERSRAAILLRPEETTLRLDQRSTITIPKPAPSGPRWLELLRGAANFLSRTPLSLKIITPFLNAHIEGTEFLVRVDEDETAILVFAGTVLAENRGGRIRLQSGEQAIAKAGQAPERSLVLRPRDAVAWALYYPPIIDFRSEPYGGDAPTLRAALSLYRQGKLAEALARLDEVPADRRDGRYFDFRAALLLSIGRVDEAQSDIAEALRLQRTDATAMALQSVIALAKNRKRKALRLARQAVALAPQSPVPRIALSYAEQASFDIEAALESSQQATQLAPDNGLAWARVAELELSLGRRGRALEAAEKAVALDPMLARTQTVLGFVALAKIQLEDAQASFEEAIRLDSADPLPRLGLGLAKIRQGDLDEGTEAIAIAASLDPHQSLIRSYLGKAYYEQKRDEWARSEFAIAKELDPKDPTPWFYEAIADQTTNRPVEALQDLQKSIALNDNRAVYRSRLLLDDDLATRNTSLGRIYTDLGFQQLAVVESAKSLSLDPANHSAHRLLSDSYLGLTRHEIARGSELLQSRLLQPITSNPVRPSRSASDIRIAGSAGPADAGFNEFSPLFERDRVRLLTSAFGGNHTTWGEETVLSALYDRYAVSLGQFHSDTEGFRANNDAKHNAYDLFAQIAVAPFLDIQTEYRFQDREQGDLRLNFDPENFANNVRQSVTEESGRIGIHLRLSPHSDFLVSALYGDIEDKRVSSGTGDPGPGDPSPFKIESLEDRTSYQFDAQYLFRIEALNVTAGGSVYHTQIDPRRRQIRPDRVVPLARPDFSRDQHSAYLYSHLNWPKPLFWTLGLSFNSYEERDTDVSDALYPKVGVQWNIADSLHVRMAYFETLRPAVLIEQTLEPTQIAGFNQFFNDPFGTQAKHYGIGIDARLSETIYGGVEALRRDITFPPGQLLREGAAIVEEEVREDLYRLYGYWTPVQEVALSAEYRFDRYELEERSDAFDDRVALTETTTVPITVRYFHPAGFFAGLGGTYIQQEVERR